MSWFHPFTSSSLYAFTVSRVRCKCFFWSSLRGFADVASMSTRNLSKRVFE